MTRPLPNLVELTNGCLDDLTLDLTTSRFIRLDDETICEIGKCLMPRAISTAGVGNFRVESDDYPAETRLPPRTHWPGCSTITVSVKSTGCMTLNHFEQLVRAMCPLGHIGRNVEYGDIIIDGSVDVSERQRGVLHESAATTASGILHRLVTIISTAVDWALPHALQCYVHLPSLLFDDGLLLKHLQRHLWIKYGEFFNKTTATCQRRLMLHLGHKAVHLKELYDVIDDEDAPDSISSW